VHRGRAGPARPLHSRSIRGAACRSRRRHAARVPAGDQPAFIADRAAQQPEPGRPRPRPGRPHPGDARQPDSWM